MQNQTNNLNLSSLRIVGQYSCGAYGAGTYDNACTTSAGGNTGAGGGLADTGYNVLIPLALAAALMIAAAILVIKRFRRQKAKPAKH